MLVSPVTVAEERTVKFANLVFEAIGTDRALAIRDLLVDGGLNALRKEAIDPKDYASASCFAKDYAAVKFLSKLEFGSGTSRKDKALAGFKASERKCESTNIRLTYTHPLPNGADQIFESARVKIERMIGTCPDMIKIIGLMTWGPGATATIKGEDVRPEQKLLEPRLSVTPQGYVLARSIVGFDLHWSKARLERFGPLERPVEVVGPCSLLSTEFNIIPWMRVVTVPKDFDKDRTIGAEPTMNTYMQQGVGRFLKQCLKRVGIDLTNQTWNQILAKVAQQYGLCTVDLSAASDTLAYWLVERLLPPAWFKLLCMLRSGYAMVEGKVIPLEKFSSMGNAFTFELETLIFYALAAAVCERDQIPTEFLSVYGDDIIMDRRAYKALVEIFQIAGFSVNTEKSYASGRFFESCGVHAFDGVDVTPFYQKELLHGIPELVRAHNRVLRWCDRTCLGSGRFRKALRFLVQEAKALTDSDTYPRLPRVPYGMREDVVDNVQRFSHRSDECIGDKGFWTRGLVVPWCDGTALLDVLEVISRKSPSISDEALLAVTLSSKVDQCDALQNPLGLGRSDPYWGSVSLRGEPEYRVRRRWVLYHGTPVMVSALSPTRFLVVDDWLTIRALVPQLRGSATLQ